jgi:hypothetical protein
MPAAHGEASLNYPLQGAMPCAVSHLARGFFEMARAERQRGNEQVYLRLSATLDIGSAVVRIERKFHHGPWCRGAL